MARFPMNFTFRIITETPVADKQRMPVPEQSIVVDSPEPDMVTMPFNACDELTCTLQLAGSSLPSKVLEGSKIIPDLLFPALSTISCTVWEKMRGAVRSTMANKLKNDGIKLRLMHDGSTSSIKAIGHLGSALKVLQQGWPDFTMATAPTWRNFGLHN